MIRVILPGMDGLNWFFDGEACHTDFMSVVSAFYSRGLFAREDRLTNAIRFGACRFLADVLDAWDILRCRFGDDLPSEVIRLWDALDSGDAASVPWPLFARALPWLLSHAPEEVVEAVLENSAPYYDIDFSVVTEDGEERVRIGTGWVDYWIINCPADSLDQVLPDYAEVEND